MPQWLIEPAGTANYILTTVGGKAIWGPRDTIPASIDDLTDVDSTSTPPDVGDALTWSGTQWVPGVPDVSEVDEKWKGVWQAAPEELVYANDFSTGLGAFTGTGIQTVMASSTGLSKPAGFTHVLQQVEQPVTTTARTVGSLAFSSLGALTGRVLTRVKVRYAYRHDQIANLTHNILWGMRINGTAFWSTTTSYGLSSNNFESTWAQAEATAGLSPTSTFTATYQVTSGSTNLPHGWLAITDFQIWATVVGWNGYVINDLVLYQGQVWQSQIDDNVDTPGTTANWVYVPKNGSVINAQTGTTYTVALTDFDKMVTLSNASAITVTVPPNSTVALPIGARITAYQGGAGQVTFAPGAGVTLRSSPGLKIAFQYGVAELMKIATDEWVVYGRLAA